MEKMGNGVAVFPSASTLIKSNDVEFPFRQDSNLYYLTGCLEPETVLILAPHGRKRSFLFVRPKDQIKELWTGPRIGVEKAPEWYGVDGASSIENFGTELPTFFENAHKVAFPFSRHEEISGLIYRSIHYAKNLLFKGRITPDRIVDTGSIIDEMRLIKDGQEIAAIKAAARITAQAFQSVMENLKPGMYEYEVEALIKYHFIKAGGGNAFETIVASGPNATVLHYTRNDRRIKESDLLLIDAGAEYQYYNADVTRTIPVGSSFGPVQRKIYNLVLSAQRVGIEAIKPGMPFGVIHERVTEVLSEGLLRLGLLKDNLATIIEEEKYKEFYPHQTGHWLGLDSHDVGSCGLDHGKRPLEPGMVLTVEPGIYIPPSRDDLPPDFRGIGVRIEDDVLVTRDGNCVLTEKIPKNPATLDRVRGKALE